MVIVNAPLPLGGNNMRLRVFLIIGIVALLAVGFRDNIGLFYHRQISDPRTVRNYFSTHRIRKLQLGAGGGYVQDWLNSDIEPTANEIYLDAMGDYPFENGSFQYIFAEHLIEHLPWEGGLKMLKECYRVLAPGGKLRIITPNIAVYFYAMSNQTDPKMQEFIRANERIFRWPQTPVGGAYVFNKEVREWGHVFVYDPPTLRRALELAGFTSIRELRVGEKTDPVFEAAEYRTHQFGEDVWLANSVGSMAFEADKKP